MHLHQWLTNILQDPPAVALPSGHCGLWFCGVPNGRRRNFMEGARVQRGKSGDMDRKPRSVDHWKPMIEKKPMVKKHRGISQKMIIRFNWK